MKNLKINVPEGYEIDSKNSTFENIVFRPIPKCITERVKSVEDACEILGPKDEEVQNLRQLEALDSPPQKLLDYQKLVVVIKALNEGWYPNFENKDCKYYPWFSMRDGQVLFCVDFYCSCARVPAPTLFKSSELVKYATSQFLDLYRSVFS